MGSFREHHAMMPLPCFPLSVAVFVGITSMPGLCHTPSSLVSGNTLPTHEGSTDGMHVAQNSLPAPVPFLVAETAP